MRDLERDNARLRQTVSDLAFDKLILQEAARESPTWRRRCIGHIQVMMAAYERLVCHLLGQHRSRRSARRRRGAKQRYDCNPVTIKQCRFRHTGTSRWRSSQTEAVRDYLTRYHHTLRPYTRASSIFPDSSVTNYPSANASISFQAGGTITGAQG